MKTLKLFLLPVLESFEFAWRVIRYGPDLCLGTSLGCEMVANRSQLTFYEESIRLPNRTELFLWLSDSPCAIWL